MTKKAIPITKLTAKILLLFALVAAVVVYTDKKGLFEPDHVNNHCSEMWEEFYKFTETDTVDVVILGNSHCYSGINPQNLSTAIGANCFILASSGTSLMDSYYSLEEALERTHPKVAIIETYTISNSENHAFTPEELSNQFKSFNARKNVPLKISSTPRLFSLENYVPAWSKSVRNHDFIFHDRTQLRENLLLSKRKPKDRGTRRLYLGRVVCFTSGIEDSTMLKYDSLGAPFKGALREVNEENALYVRKITNLCKQHGVTPVFVTLPMYYRHVENYDAWKSVIASVIQPTGADWLDLQAPYDTALFDRNCFENAYTSNQHMTYEGSLRGTYKIAHFLVDSLRIDFPERSATKHWNDLFYGGEGYFENYASSGDDTTNVLICKDLTIDGFEIKDCIVIKGEPYSKVYLKVPKTTDSEPANPLSFWVEVSYHGEKRLASMDCWRQVSFDPLTHDLYYCPIEEGIELLEIKGLTISRQ